MTWAGTAGVPVLRLRTAWDVRLNEDAGFAPIIDMHGGTAAYDHDITLGLCTGASCPSAAVIFSAYRQTSVSSLGADAVLRDTGLTFTHSVTPAGNTAGAGFSPGCPVIVFAIGAPLIAALMATPYNDGALTALEWVERLYGAGGPFLGLGMCVRLQDIVNSVIDRTLDCNAASFDQLGDVMVNPPALRAPVESVLVAGGFDTSGNGGIESGELASALMMLTGGALSSDDANNIAFALDSAPTRVVPLDQMSVGLSTTGSILAGDGESVDTTAGELSGPGGELTDRTVRAVRRGTIGSPGSAGAPDVTIVTMRVDLRALRGACDSGIAPGTFDTICGLCTSALARPELCDRGRLRDFIELTNPDGTTSVDIPIPSGAIPPFAIPRSPGLAQILETAPLFGETLREIFYNALPSGSRYTAATETAGGSATFTFIVDPDHDGLDSGVETTLSGGVTLARDLCPDVYDPSNESDTDGDAFGRACDRCPGVRASFPFDNLDRDADGTANACDCDIDGDGCFNEGSYILPGIPGAPPLVQACSIPADQDPDPYPGHPSIANFDRDAVPDDCDTDDDNDGIPSDFDNCPRGNGDDLWEPILRCEDGTCTFLRDQDPDQTDSNSDGVGDLCDPNCPPTCVVPPAITRIPREPGVDLRDYLPVPFECPGVVCGTGLFASCIGDPASCLSSEVTLVAQLAPDGHPVTEFQQPYGSEIGSEWGIGVAAIPDRNGDGIDEVLLGLPRALGSCKGQVCTAGTGAVVIADGGSGKPLDWVAAGNGGDLYGAAFARSGEYLAIGAPNAKNGAGSPTGAVYVYALRERLVLLGTAYGEHAGDRFGASVARMTEDGGRDEFLAGAPGAPGPAGARVGSITRLDRNGAVVQTFLGGIAGAEMSVGVALRDHGRLSVVGAAPLANGGAGALFFFNHRGARVRTVLGAPGDRLGASLLAAPALGYGVLAAGAPGFAGGRGAVMRYDIDARPLGHVGWYGTSFGLALVEGSDTDDDGIREILVGYVGHAGGEARAATLQVHTF